MRNIEKTVCVMVLCLSCVTASAPFVAVEFGGWVTGSDMGYARGTRVVGYFTYEAGSPSGEQVSSRPNFVFEIPAHHSRFERDSYNFAVYNDRLPGDVRGDGFALEFPYPSGYGTLGFGSSNVNLFPDNLLPPTIPPLEQFDIGAALYLILDQVQPYRATRIVIDHLSVVPQPELGRPIIHAVERNAAGFSFRFLTKPSTGYAVEFTDNLANSNWLTLTNIASAREPVVTINDQSGLGQRFYRIRKN